MSINDSHSLSLNQCLKECSTQAQRGIHCPENSRVVALAPRDPERTWTGKCGCDEMEPRHVEQQRVLPRHRANKLKVTWWWWPWDWIRVRVAAGVGRCLLQVSIVYLLIACWALWEGQIPSPPLIIDTSRFVSSEPSVPDQLHLVSVSLLASTLPPQNESLPKDEVVTEDPSVAEEAVINAGTTPLVKKNKEAVSDATLPPDLIPKEDQFPTSTPNVATTEEPKAVTESKRTEATNIVNEVPITTVTDSPPKLETPIPPPEVLPPASENVVVEIPSGPASNVSEDADTGEEIPSFNEWAQKKLADAEKRKVQNASETPKTTLKPSSNLKVRSKNYASPDCGAKILAANPEAQSVSSVLSPSQDEYALNPCTSSKIWFVVELCEAIQAKQVSSDRKYSCALTKSDDALLQIEVANFELFSSSPKDFSVWVSDRFPTREWHQVGQFTAVDERNIQSFSFNSNIFGKFLKVEMHTHWGSEHFCPVSLMRVYGTSEFEVLDVDEHESRLQDDDDDGDDVLSAATGEDVPKNLFGSARDAVISIVQKAAQVLGKSGDSKNKTESATGPVLEQTCGMSPLQGQECSQCSPAVQQLLLCHSDVLHSLLASRFVLHSIQQEQLCLQQGKTHNRSYLAALLPAEYITALCHLLLSLHHPHSTTSSPNYDNLTLDQSHDQFLLLQPSETTTCGQQESPVTPKPIEKLSPAQASVPPAASSLPVSASDVASKIKPTRTLKEREMSIESRSSAPVIATLLPSTPAAPSPSAGSTLPAENSTAMVTETSAPVTLDEVSVDIEYNKATEEWPTAEPLDTLIAELKEQGSDLEHTVAIPTTSTEPEFEAQIPSLPSSVPSTTSSTVSASGPQQGQQKESVLVRLANRVKALERNLSLSSQYLEEISRRYKRQMDDMQKAFERTLTAVGESARQAIQREQSQAEHIAGLEQRLGALAATTAALLEERDSWQYKLSVISQHIVLAVVLLYLVVSLVRQCSPSASCREPTPEPLAIPPLRRHSMEGLRLANGSRYRKRRPSEETVSCGQKKFLRMDSLGGDPSKKKRRKLRRELQGVSVEDLCSGLSPATLAAVRLPDHNQRLHVSKPRSVGSSKSRRYSTESAPVLKDQWSVPPSELTPPPEVKVNGTAEHETVINDIVLSNSSPAIPSQHQQPKKQSGLRKMVRKLF